MNIISIILLVILLYLAIISTRPAKNVSDKLRNNMYAHRGLYNNTSFPIENTMKAFERAINEGFGIELDVQRTKDAKLVVFHDAGLKRLLDKDIKIADLNFDELQQYKFADGSSVPLFKDVLNLIDAKVPIIIEVKYYKEKFKTIKQTVEELKGYKGLYCIESFHPAIPMWLRFKQPTIIRGQLSQGESIFSGGADPLSLFIMKYFIFNLFAAPNFISYYSKADKNIPMFLMKNLFKPMLAAYTLKTPQDLAEAKSKGYTMLIFEEGALANNK